MCGIAAGVDTRGRGRAVPWALETMGHRGPDGSGTLVVPEAEAVLEHCRLAIIDPENRAADQPFTDATGRWSLAYNGELFNFRELRRELQQEGAVFRTHSDTEVVLECLIRHGADAIPRFQGMFAFLLLDRETGEILAARDQMGVKPLYWTLQDGLFLAASELRTLIAHPRLSPELDPSSVVEFLAYGHVAGPRTLLKGVHKLQPAHGLRLQHGDVSVFEYWDLLTPDPRSSEPVSAEQLLARLDDAVGASMVSDVPISLMLSGGLDSSLIAALAVRHSRPESLTAYSVSFGLPTDESAVASRLAGDLGIDHHEIALTQSDLASSFDQWLAGMDVPSGNPTWAATWQIARRVKEAGGKVLLAGDGGDELFGGYNRWMAFLRFERRFWRFVPSGVRRTVGYGAAPVARGRFGDLARRARDGKNLFVGSRTVHDGDLFACLGPVGRTAAAERPAESTILGLQDRFDRSLPEGDYLAWMSYVGLQTGLVEDYLGRLDTMGMRESVEGRVPLLDPLLAGWAFHLPQAVKVPGFEQKALFRRASEKVLPHYVTSRPKQGFCPPIVDWASALMSERVRGKSVLADEGLIAGDAADRLNAASAGGSYGLWTLGSLLSWTESNL